MIPEKIAFLFILAFFLIVFIQSGVDKVFDYKGNLSFLNDLLKIYFLTTINCNCFNFSNYFRINFWNIVSSWNCRFYF